MKKLAYLLGISMFTFSCGETEANSENSSTTEEITVPEGPVQFSDGVLKCQSGAVNVNGQEFEKEVVFGSELKLELTGIEGLTVENGQTQIQTLQIWSHMGLGDTVMATSFEDREIEVFDMEESGLLNYGYGITVEKPLFHRAGLHRWELWIKDVATGEILKATTAKIKIIPSDFVRVTNGPDRFEYSEVSFYDVDNKRYLLDDTVEAGGNYVVDFQELREFVLIDDKPSIGISLKIKDLRGSDAVLLDVPDMIEPGFDGFDLELLRENVAVDVMVPESISTEKFSVDIKVWDKNGPGNLRVIMDLVVRDFYKKEA